MQDIGGGNLALASLPCCACCTQTLAVCSCVRGAWPTFNRRQYNNVMQSAQQQGTNSIRCGERCLKTLILPRHP